MKPTQKSAPALQAPHNSGERVQNGDTALAGADTPSSVSTPAKDATELADKWRAEAATHIAAALEEEDIGCDDWFLHREAARIYERCAKELAALSAGSDQS